jgi:hypothetical protein
MQVITRQIKANEVTETWRQQYPFYSSEKNNIYRRLKSLGQTPDPNTVDKIIGNKSWTEVECCSECGKRPKSIIRLGEPLHHESLTAYICLDCLKKAIKLMKGISDA